MNNLCVRNRQGTIRIVLVEDFKLIRIGIRMVLEADESLQVIAESDNGKQAIEQIEAHNPDLVILDLGLPDIDGLQLTRQIRDFNPDIKILILTSHDTEDSVMMALSAGANAYCLKDIVSNRLVEVVKSVCEGAVWLDPRVASQALQIFAMRASKRVKNAQLALTVKEREVLRLIVEGMSNTQIAKALEISLHTTKAHVCSVLQKLSVQDRMQAAVKAVQHSLL